MTNKKKKILIGVGVGLAALTVYSLYQKANKPNLYIRNSLPFGANAITLPPVGVFVDKNHAADIDTLNQTLCDWERYQRSGWFLYYLQNGVRALLPGACAPAISQTENTCS